MIFSLVRKVVAAPQLIVWFLTLQSRIELNRKLADVNAHLEEQVNNSKRILHATVLTVYNEYLNAKMRLRSIGNISANTTLRYLKLGKDFKAWHLSCK